MSLTAESEYRGLGPPVGAHAAGVRLDQFLGRAFPFRSRTVWQDFCRRGEVRVNGVVSPGTRRLKNGDVLDVYHPIEREPSVDGNIAVIGEESGVLALYKPANLPMHEHGDYRRNTFLAIVAERFGPEWFPLHRLDVETSGVVLWAATHALRSSLCAAFRHRTVKKTYDLIVHGTPSWNERVVDEAISRDEGLKKPRFVASRDDEDGLDARTDFLVIERRAHASWLKAMPHTGRTSQIRVHAHALGHPIIGDKSYLPCDGATVSAPRQLLHAGSISFTHPDTKRCVTFEAEWPSDLKTAWPAASQGIVT